MRLSILVLSTHTRRNTFLPKSLEIIYSQYEKLNEIAQNEVEILFLVDNKKMSVGTKRNKLISISQGQYYVFCDDDDRVSDDYIKTLLDATYSDKDVISFNAEVTINGKNPRLCDYSIKHKKDYNSDKYYRIPNHICCVKRSVGLEVKFKDIMFGEDADYSKKLLPYIKSEHKIDKILYYYDYNQSTSETREHNKNDSKPIVDIVILSKASNQQDKAMTQKTIDTAISTVRGYNVNVIVIEQSDAVYNNAKTIKKTCKFNYNKFANYGASKGKAEWIMIANNDLEFSNKWLRELLLVNHPVMSPYNPNDKRQRIISSNTFGCDNGVHFSGWCFMIRRKLWESIGGFDEDVDFWCSDDAVIEQVKSKNITPMIVKSSVVHHLGGQTLKKETGADDLRWKNVAIFNKKYGKNKFAGNRYYEAWKENNRGSL